MPLSGPVLVIPSRKGSVPNLTPAQARSILLPEERVISLSVFEAQEFVVPCSEAGITYADFCGLGGFTTVLTIRSALQGLHSNAPASDKGIFGDYGRGRVAISHDKWKATIAALKPSVAVGMYDTVSLQEPQSKKRRVAVARTESWNAATVREDECTVLKPLSASFPNCDAVYVDVMPLGENALEFAQNLESVHFSATLQSMCCAQSLPALLAALHGGVQLIECPLPWALAEKGIALTLSFCNSKPTFIGNSALLDLNDGGFALDIAHLGEGCTCYTCQRHCRAYIHHLLTVQEMNSIILLTIHNLTTLVTLLRLYRAASPIAREDLVQNVLSQL